MRHWRAASASPRRVLAAIMVAGLTALDSGAAAVPAHAETIRSQEWHINAMKLPEAWQISKGQGVTVAVIDSGVDASLPDLNGQILPGRDFSPGIEAPVGSIQRTHASSMASLIAGTGRGAAGAGAIGVAPEAKILSLRVVGDEHKNAAVSDAKFTEQLARAIRYAADSNARIFNISLAFLDSTKALEGAIKYALGKGKLIFAGVGNDGNSANPRLYPAALPGVVGVAALDRNGNATAESEKGPQVALSAAGMDMFDACPGGTGYCKSHGTSDATAVVSGSAALVWARHPDWTANQVLRVLINTAAGPSDGTKRNDAIGYGAVRPRVALETPGDPGPPDVNPLLATVTSGTPKSSDSKSTAGPSPSEAASGANPSGGGSVWPWFAAGGGLVLVAAIGGVVFVRRHTA